MIRQMIFLFSCSPIPRSSEKSGFDYNLSFSPKPPKPKRHRSKSAIWFNPSYSANVATDIGLNKPSENPPKECNYRQKESCPLRGKCLTESVVYQATVTRKDTNIKKPSLDLRKAHLRHDTITTRARSGTQNTNIQLN